MGKINCGFDRTCCTNTFLCREDEENYIYSNEANVKKKNEKSYNSY